MAVGPTRPRIQWIVRCFSVVKRQGSEVDLTPTSRSKTEWEDKYNVSVNSTTLYFTWNKNSTVRATCFDLYQVIFRPSGKTDPRVGSVFPEDLHMA